MVPATFCEERNSLAQSTGGTKLFTTVSGVFAILLCRKHFWGSISTHVVVPTKKKRTPRSRYEESTLQQPLFGEYTTSTEPENPKRFKMTPF